MGMTQKEMARALNAFPIETQMLLHKSSMEIEAAILATDFSLSDAGKDFKFTLTAQLIITDGKDGLEVNTKLSWGVRETRESKKAIEATPDWVDGEKAPATPGE